MVKISTLNRTEIKHIILSRKGFDSEYGKIPSPIFPDGTLFSFPIPSTNDLHTYGDLYCASAGKNVATLLEDLTGKSFKKLNCHLDPDLNKNTITRPDGWRALFGQCSAAQKHLQNNGVGINDIFMFFGRFRPVEKIKGKWQFIKGTQDKHLIFGYLQIGKIINLYKGEETLPWMSYHPHVINNSNKYSNNTVYLPSDNLSLLTNLEGAGLLNYAPKRILTKDGFSISRWNLPKDVFETEEISYHSAKSWKDEYFQSVAKGQEFVVTASNQVLDWTINILK